MGRILLIVIIGFVAWLLFRGMLGSARKPRDSQPQTLSDDFVPCAECGVNIPKSEARLEAGAWHCRDGTACVQRKT